jgi:hypothetical protein
MSTLTLRKAGLIASSIAVNIGCSIDFMTVARQNDVKVSAELSKGMVRREGDCAIGFDLPSGVTIRMGEVTQFAGHRLAFTSTCQAYALTADAIEGLGNRSFYVDNTQVLRHSYDGPATRDSSIVR